MHSPAAVRVETIRRQRLKWSRETRNVTVAVGREVNHGTVRIEVPET